jgi:hypothetical protein
MKIAVIGAGSVGISVKYFLNRKQIDSTLYEATNNIGGILRDITVEGMNFFAGCQYFSNKEIAYEFMPKTGLKSFVYAYGSYTDIFDEISVSTEFVGPTMKKQIELNTPRDVNSLDISVEEKLKEYPPFIGFALQNWLAGIGINSSQMHQSSLLGLGAIRVYLPNQIEDVQIMRRDRPSASNFYGLLYSNYSQDDTFSVPFDGFNSYLDSNVLPEIIKDTDTNVSLKIEINKTGFRLRGNKALKPYDKIIWTGNPNPILKCLNLPKLDSHNLKCKILVGEINIPVDKPFYIQVFSKKSNILRIYLYKIKNKSCFTIEKIEDLEPPDDTVKFAIDILESFGIIALLDLKTEKKQNRYVLHTLDDYKSLKALNQILSSTNLIPAGWHLYGRDSKVGFVLDQINNLQRN